MSRLSLRDWLVAGGHCTGLKEAEALIIAGKVLVNDVPAKAGQQVSVRDRVRLRDKPLPYAAKGGLKLEGAIRAFHLNPSGRVCLDAGASTGGFTDCLIKHGAKLVYAVDAGFGQLTGTLRQDPRVVNLEKTNISDPSLLELNPRPDFASCDLSYLSLRKAIPAYLEILHGQGDIAALVKPLFEVDDAKARRSGVLKDTAYEPLLQSLIINLNSLEGVFVRNVCESPVKGNHGTLEFFLHIRLGIKCDLVSLDEEISVSVHRALLTASYQKGFKAKDE